MSACKQLHGVSVSVTSQFFVPCDTPFAACLPLDSCVVYINCCSDVLYVLLDTANVRLPLNSCVVYRCESTVVLYHVTHCCCVSASRQWCDLNK